MQFYHSRILTKKFDEAVAAVTEALKKEGFGVLTSINLTEKFREKLNIAFRNYVILGACNPSLAHKALQLDNKIGVMLPCNVIVQDVGNAQVEVSSIDPMASMSVVGNAALSVVAEEVSAKLKRVIEAL
jgi:uncharacterized protein (DUF302 family)